MKDYPRVLVITNTCISPSHGTGAVLLKHFNQYPPDRLLNVYLDKRGIPSWPSSVRACQVGSRRWSAAWFQVLGGRAVRKLLRRFGAGHNQMRVPYFEDVRSRLQTLGFHPDVIYANGYSVHDLALLGQLIVAYGPTVPVIQHFHDYQRDAGGLFYSLLDELNPHLTEVWTLTESMAADVRSRLSRTVEVASTFRSDVPPNFKRTHRELTKDFQVVLLGNVWMPEVLQDLRRVWGICQSRHKLPAIRWMGHPKQVEMLRKAKIQIEPEIRYTGFEERLHEALVQVDMAILPLNRGKTPANDYERFSLPSRITDFACAGLPIFCIAGKGTETKRYIEENEIGVCASPSENSSFAGKLMSFLVDTKTRERCGANARLLAEREFALEPYQQFLYSKFTALANQWQKISNQAHISEGR